MSSLITKRFAKAIRTETICKHAGRVFMKKRMETKRAGSRSEPATFHFSTCGGNYEKIEHRELAPKPSNSGCGTSMLLSFWKI